MQTRLFYLLLSLSLLPLCVMGQQISMLFAHSLGPYVIEQEDSGLEIEIIREALASQGYELVPVYSELSNLPEMYQNNRVDAIQTSFNVGRDSEGFYGDVSVQYQDVLVTLDKRNIDIKHPEDLEPYSLLAFQNAHLIYPGWLPEGYVYNQTAKQIDQVRLLQLGLVDVVLSDKNIFNVNVRYYRNSVSQDLLPMRVHYFAPPFNFGPMFKSQKVAEAFNRGLQQLKDSGRYTQILSSLIPSDPAILVAK